MKTKNKTLQLEPTQQLLLEACLLPGELAVKPWQQWLQQVNIDTLEPSSYYLLSLLYRNLSGQQIQDPELPRLKGVFRRHWTYNQVLLKTTAFLLEQLQAAGVDVIVVGDLVWFTQGYKEEKQRPSLGLDWLVPEFETSRDILKHQGWNLVSEGANGESQTWQQPEKTRLTLHKHLFFALPQRYTDQQVWENSVITEIAGVRVRRLSLTDQLLVTSRQTMVRQGKSRRRLLIGLVDGFKLLQMAATELDWIRLVQQAQRYETILPLRTVLGFLQENFAIQMPDWVLPSLFKMPISHYELLTYDLRYEPFPLKIKGVLMRQIRAYQSLLNTQK